MLLVCVERFFSEDYQRLQGSINTVILRDVVHQVERFVAKEGVRVL